VGWLAARAPELCDNLDVSLTMQWLLAGVAAVVGGVFVLAFRFALREAAERAIGIEPELPRAGLHVRAGRRWLRGARKQQIIAGFRLLHAAIVAFAITSVFIMFLCMVGVCVAMLLGA
jgi:hypothetical protein